MGQQQWDFFYSRISQKVSHDRNAGYILNLAISTLKSLDEIDQLSECSTTEAFEMMLDVLGSKERGEIQVFVYVLDYKADRDVRVKALQGRFLRYIS